MDSVGYMYIVSACVTIIIENEVMNLRGHIQKYWREKRKLYKYGTYGSKFSKIK